jgi:CelD/BcsL family acetyltransferase involved in cellulose biosynthesis
MSAKPLLDEMLSSPSAAPAIGLLDQGRLLDNPETNLAIGQGDGVRRFSVYHPSAAFDLEAELDFLTRRSIDQNVFFAPQFLIPAMPRLDERHVRLMVVRDEGPQRSRLRFLMPYSIERTGLFGGQPAIRAWTHPFGPLGTPLVDSDDPEATLESLLETLSRKELGFPSILVLPEVRSDEPFAKTLLAVAARLGLPVATAHRFERAALDAGPGASMAGVLSSKRRRELQRQRRLLEAKGTVTFDIARAPHEVRPAMEEFLGLEASGWKGRQRSALIMDRYRAAFARESIHKLAEKDRTRIFTLRLNGEAIASLVAFVIGGEAFAWKMGFDEAHAAASPGLQMMVLATEALIADPEVVRADSCAVPDHFLMNRLWKQRLPIETLVVGLTRDSGRAVERAAHGLEQARRTRNAARLMRQRVKAVFGRS